MADNAEQGNSGGGDAGGTQQAEYIKLKVVGQVWLSSPQ